MTYHRPMKDFGLMIVATAFLASCGTLGSSKLPENPYAPAVDYRGESVDGLLVGHRLLAAGEYELALNAFTRAAAEQGMTADVLGALGTANLQLGRLGQAEKQLREAIEIDEDYFEAWNNLGVVLLETDRTPEAVQILRKAFALSNGDSDEIRDNLRLALAKFDNSQYTEEQNTYKLVGRGGGNYLLRTTP